MRLFKRGKTYYCHVYDSAGQRRQVSTRCHDLRAAEAAARRIEREAADPDHTRTAAATLGDALALLLDRTDEAARAGKRSTATADFYRKKAGTLSRIFEHDGDRYAPFLLAQLRPRHVDDYISERRAEGVSENTISKELITLRGALKLAKRAELWRGDIDELVPPAFAPEYKPRRTHATREGLALLLAELQPDHAARVAFIVATSATWSDTDRAQRADVTGDRAHVRGTKRATRDRVVPLAQPWQRDLMAYALEHAEGTAALFLPWVNVRRDLHAACDRAGIPRLSPNDLRRTTGTWLRAEGVPAEYIAVMMGHTTARMAELVYARLSTDDLGSLVSTASRVHQSAAALMQSSEPSEGRTGKKRRNSVPRDGIEPPTRGFSIRALWLPKPSESRQKRTGAAGDCITGASGWSRKCG